MVQVEIKNPMMTALEMNNRHWMRDAIESGNMEQLRDGIRGRHGNVNIEDASSVCVKKYLEDVVVSLLMLNVLLCEEVDV